MDSEHDRITAAGWPYHLNQRGLTIYREPQTGHWYTRDEAISKLAALSQKAKCLESSRRIWSGLQDVPAKIRHAASLSVMAIRGWFDSRSRSNRSSRSIASQGM